MDVCPNCGSTDRTAPEFGRWRCTNLVNRPQSVEVADQNIVLGPNAYGRRMAVMDHWVPCGTEYPDTTPYATNGTQSCRCGLFAVGVCRTCSNPVCGPHMQLVDSVVRCTFCLQAEAQVRADAAAVQAREAEAAAEVERQAADRTRQVERDAAAARGEPLDVPGAAQALVKAAAAALVALGSPGLYPVASELKRNGKVKSTFTAWEVDSGSDTLKHNTDYRGPYTLWTRVVDASGQVLLVEAVGVGPGAFIRVTRMRTDDSEYPGVAMRFGFAAVDRRARFVVPWVLTCSSPDYPKSEELFVRLRERARPR